MAAGGGGACGGACGGGGCVPSGLSVAGVTGTSTPLSGDEAARCATHHESTQASMRVWMALPKASLRN